jgi:hypothetical protein
LLARHAKPFRFGKIDPRSVTVPFKEAQQIPAIQQRDRLVLRERVGVRTIL